MELTWTAGEQGSQVANGDVGNYAQYLLAARHGRYVLTLDVRHDGEARDWDLGEFASEAEAKQAAEKFEADTHHPDDDCGKYAEGSYMVRGADGETTIADLEVGDTYRDQASDDWWDVTKVGRDSVGAYHVDVRRTPDDEIPESDEDD